jgi:hypothetical protein
VAGCGWRGTVGDADGEDEGDMSGDGSLHCPICRSVIQACVYDCAVCKAGTDCRTCYECDVAWAKENFS